MAGREREISKTIERVIKGRGWKKVECAKRLGMSKQAFNYVLKEKEDWNWKEWEVKEVCAKLKIGGKERERIIGELCITTI